MQTDFDTYANIADAIKRGYYAIITAIDSAIGRIVDQLEKNKIDRETIIFFANDNGGSTYRLITHH